MSTTTGDGGYMHRQMRCKGTASILFKGKRYRPGDYIDCELPAEYADQIEPVPEKPAEAKPAPLMHAHPTTKHKPTAPPLSEEIADPFGNFGKKRKD